PRRPAENEYPEVAAVEGLALSPDGRLLFTRSIRWRKDPPGSGGVHNASDIWDGRSGKHLHRLAKPGAWDPPATFAPAGGVRSLGGHSQPAPPDGRLRADALTAWNPLSGTVLRRFGEANPAVPRDDRRHDGSRQVTSLAVSPDGRLLAA